jgi:hypothetical protein
MKIRPSRITFRADTEKNHAINLGQLQKIWRRKHIFQYINIIKIFRKRRSTLLMFVVIFQIANEPILLK